MKTIDSVYFANKHVLIRIDFNVPLDEKFNVTDSTRIRAAVPTIIKILADGGSVALMSHLGRPKGGYEEKFSLRHIVKTLEQSLGVKIRFVPDCVGEETTAISQNLKNGEVILLENLRFYKEEEKGDEAFAKKLSLHGDYYINDAFGAAHRAHASTTVIAKFFPGNKCFGYVMSGEIENINKVIHQAKKPFTAILGGAKVSDKILILEQLMKKADNIIIGGAMAFTFVKALGGKTGKSMVEEDKLDIARNILSEGKKQGVNIYIPDDAVIADNFSNEAAYKICSTKEIPEGWMGLDIGPQTEKNYRDVILKSATILWNGPMGVFEMSHFEHGTRAVAEAVVESTSKGAYSLVGGGDTVAAINKYNLDRKVSYVSTGGGAMLEYIENGTLPGVQAMEN